MDIGGEGDIPDVLLDQHDVEQRANLNINDVFEAISLADPSFAADGAVLEESMARVPPPQGGPYVRIVEQPASKALRFRYECEGRSAGSIPGVNSTQDRKSYPTIEIVGHTGKAIVVVSCVTREEPHKPHPHNLVGRDRCNRGVCTQRIDVTPDNSLVTFSNLGIQCVKRRDIAEALRVREELRVDPFRTGYAHRNQPQSIDLNAVRLCFQVFLPDDAGKVRHSLAPVVSDVIFDKKAMSDLQILRISCSAGSARGGTELILLCEKVTREDIAVVFYEERREKGAGSGGYSAVVWEEAANVVMVHKQVAIAFTTPAYRDPHTQDHVEVFIQLKRPTDGARSVGIPFTYIPEYQDTDYLKRKRQKTLHSSLIQQIEQERATWQAEQKPIKAEPSDKSPMHMGSSPRRLYTQPEQQWIPQQQHMQGGLPEQSASGMSSQYYGGDMQWSTASYQPVTPVMQAGLSPRSPLHASLPATSPSLHVMTPNIQVISPNMQGMSPHPQQVLSPQHQQVLSPRHQQVMSPQHQQVLSPQHQQVLSPQHQQVMSPQHQQVMSPQHQQVMSPQHQRVMSPHHQQDMSLQHQQEMSLQHQHVMSPQHQQVMSPQHQQVMSPQHQQEMSLQHQHVMSPRHQQVMSPHQQQVMSPQHPQQVMSPQLQQVISPHMSVSQATVMSPQHMGLDDRQGMAQGHVSPNMGQVSPNMGHVSPNLVQQAMPQQQMETNSTPSLSRLLMDQGEPITLNSGDLSNLSALLNQTYRSNELSDSLNRLSTSDLFTERAELQ